MRQDYYQYIYHLQQKQLEFNQVYVKRDKRATEFPPLRKRFLLSISNALLGIGQRIRPAEFQVKVLSNQANESALEIKAGGC